MISSKTKNKKSDLKETSFPYDQKKLAILERDMAFRKNWFFLLFLMFLGPLGMTQVLTGIVHDQSNQQALAYVNIAIKGSHTGTVSRFDGTYNLDIGAGLSDQDSVIFSIIGFKKHAISIGQLKANPKVILSPTAVNLESLIVSPRSPEEYIQLAIDKIPENYIDQPFNGTIYFRTEIRLNGKFIEASEAIVKGYIMPVMGSFKDSTRLRMLAYKYFEEQDEAINSITIKKRKKEKMAIEGLDTIMLELTDQLSESFGLYTQIDSNLIKQMYSKGYTKGKAKFWFENMIQHEDRNLMKIGFLDKSGMIKEQGNLLLDDASLAFETYNHQVSTSSLKIKMLLLLFGIGFKGADAVIQFKSVPSEQGWIPDLMDVNLFVEMEKNKWFAKDIPIVIEVNSHMRFLDIEMPATDLCKEGDLIKKKKPLKDQFKSDPGNPLWKEYRSVIERKN